MKMERTSTVPRIRTLSLIILTFFTWCLHACVDQEVYTKPEDALEAGREFIRASLNGDFRKAEMYVLHDEENDRLFKRFRDSYERMTDEEKRLYKESNIIINTYLPQGDSIYLINFANSYKKKALDLKVVKDQEEWWVDFKYTFSGNLPLE